MNKLILGICGTALITMGGLVAGQTIQSTPATPTSADTSTATATPVEPTAPIRLTAADTSMDAFRKLDTDHDGRISALEANANPRVAELFVMADKDHDGYLSREEFEALNSTQMHAEEDASGPSGDQPASDPTDTAPSDTPSPRNVPHPKH
jgi:hypothetical protein